MGVETVVGLTEQFAVEALFTAPGFVSHNQEDALALRIEGKGYSPLAAGRATFLRWAGLSSLIMSSTLVGMIISSPLPAGPDGRRNGCRPYGAVRGRSAFHCPRICLPQSGGCPCGRQ